MTIRQFRKKIFKFFRPLIKAPDQLTSSKFNIDKAKTKEEILDREYSYFFENSEEWMGIDDFDNPLY